MKYFESLPFKIISVMILFFFLSTFGGFIDIAYAIEKELNQSSNEQKKAKTIKTEKYFEKTLDELEKILQDTATDTNTKKNKVKVKKDEIEVLDIEIKEQFSATEKKLKDAGLPSEILERHYNFIKHYENNIKELKKNLQEIEKAKDKAETDDAIENTKKFLEKIKPPKKHIPADPNKLPHRTPEPKFIEPRTNPEQLDPVQTAWEINQSKYILIASNGSLKGILNSSLPDAYDYQNLILLAQADPPTSADLAETIEVQFTPAIQAKAEELEHNPVKIYNWVRNNIEFVPTYGSIQGADYCLKTKQCNAFDTSSLLIALLRASGIHSRYAYGTIELPIEKVKNWVGGFTDAYAALTLIASGKVPVTGLKLGGKIEKVRMEHTWVEAWVDYIPYRGALHVTGDTWIPLDASYKQYNYIDGIDAGTAVPTDFQAFFDEVDSQSTINNEIPSITNLPTELILNHLSDFKTSLEEYLTTNHPEVDSYYEKKKLLHGYKEIIQKELRFLPNTLADMRVIAELDKFSEIPETLRHKISFNLNNESVLNDNPLVFTTSLPAIAGKRITLSYIPATPADAQVMASSEGIINFPLYLVEVTSELKIEGQTVATGGSIGMGKNQAFKISFSNPQNTTEYVNNIVQAGEYYAVGLNVNKVNFQYLFSRANQWRQNTLENRDDRIGEFLFIAAMFYFGRADYFNEVLAQSSDVVSVRHPSACLVSLKFNANYIFGIPMVVNSVGLNTDVDLDLSSPISKENNDHHRFWYMINTGIYASGLEFFIFKYLMNFEAISTTKFLYLSNQQASPIYILDSENIQRVDELYISSLDKQDIRNYINNNKLILVQKNTIQYIDYSGIGYLAVDTQSGTGAYMISGGYNGSDTVGERVDEILKLADELVGKGKQWSIQSYKESIYYIMANNPHLEDSPVSNFPDFDQWSQNLLHDAEMLDWIDSDRLNVSMAQTILSQTQAYLVAIAGEIPPSPPPE